MSGEELVIDIDAPEIRALQLMIDDKPQTARVVLAEMPGKDRAVLMYYFREMGYMIERIDSRERLKLTGGVAE